MVAMVPTETEGEMVVLLEEMAERVEMVRQDKTEGMAAKVVHSEARAEMAEKAVMVKQAKTGVTEEMAEKVEPWVAMEATGEMAEKVEMVRQGKTGVTEEMAETEVRGDR